MFSGLQLLRHFLSWQLLLLKYLEIFQRHEGKKEQRGKERTQEEVGVTQGFVPKQSQVVGVLGYKTVVIGIEASESQHDAVKKRAKTH